MYGFNQGLFNPQYLFKRPYFTNVEFFDYFSHTLFKWSIAHIINVLFTWLVRDIRKLSHFFQLFL